MTIALSETTISEKDLQDDLTLIDEYHKALQSDPSIERQAVPIIIADMHRVIIEKEGRDIEALRLIKSHFIEYPALFVGPSKQRTCWINRSLSMERSSGKKGCPFNHFSAQQKLFFLNK